ncbi:TonB-dependent siderophore receptor [Paucibacter sp. PLA-PC-4]|uniref:TonB-dependent siderophore receptor n=1 Tax=Paucibacter sp. PLA-PC-4 TaxID=2993655 RepID=UPI0022494034|nr:TonB-dependent siderophore receptor [Paucibacter sp. PLA-PC-4]MCX2861085.1 TonB-dependent siderophore receptor [Paucibacter sp. PLA-PC-4]
MSMIQNTRFFARAALPAALCTAFSAGAADVPKTEAATSQLETVQILGVKQPYRNLSATGATKSDALLKDLPQSVRVLSADMLQDAGVTKLADALDLGSGIAKQSNLGGLWDSYAMRGFTGDPNFGSDYMVNGFNYSRGYNGLRDAANTSTVEILKGPASALYGRGEPGGTVNITTKKPLFQPAQTLELSAGSDGALRASADLTGPIGERLAYRLNAAAEKADSYRDHLGSERYLLSPSLIWMLTPDTTVSYELEVSRQRANFDRGVLAINGKLGVLPRSRFLGEPGDGRNVIETTGHQVFVQHYFNDDWSLQTGFSVRDSSLEGISTEGRFLQADQRTLVRQRRSRDNEASDVSGRLELLGKLRGAGLMHNLLVGVDAYRFTDERLQYRNANAGNLDIYAPVYGLVATTMALTTDTKEKQRSHSLYAQDQIDLGAQWKMLLGLRHDKYKQSLLNHRSGNTTEQSLSATTPRIGLVYQPSKTLSLYATASKSFRPNSGVSSAFASFPAEKGKAYELGAKLDSADGKISSTLALYKISKNNVLTPDPVDPNNFSVAAGEVESQGLEFDIAGQIMPGLRLSGAYAFTDAKVTEDNNAFLLGRQLANVPKHSANLMLVKSFSLWGNAATLGLGLNHVGKREGAVAPLAASEDFKLPAYTSIKLISSYQLASKLRLSLDIDNLCDKLYYASSYSQIWVYPGNGRKLTLTAQYKF